MESRIKGLRKVKLGDIDPFKFGNPRARSERDAGILGASMEEFGYVLPMVVRACDGRFELLDGHHRFERIVDGRPVELYEDDKAEVLVVDVPDDMEARRLILALKPQADWDFAALEEYVKKLLDDGDSAESIMGYTGLTADLVDALASAGSQFLDDMAGGGEETNETASRAGLTPEHVTFSTPLTREQNEIVHRALTVAKKLGQLAVAGDAITAICTYYLESNK